MSLRPVRDRYSSDKEQARRATHEQFVFIVSNIEALESVDRFGAHEKFLDSITERMENDGELLEWEVSRVEQIYELTMKGLGLPSVPVHRDKRMKGLRF